MSYYRFKCGVFVEADNFEQAQLKLIKMIASEDEEHSKWYKCTCRGLSHRHGCPEAPHNKGEIPY